MNKSKQMVFVNYFKNLQQCLNEECEEKCIKEYFSKCFDDLAFRTIIKTNPGISRTILSDYLNFPLVISNRIFEAFQGGDLLSQNSFVNGMFELFFGSLECLEAMTFKIMDVSSKHEIIKEDIFLLLKYLNYSCGNFVKNIEEIVTDFFSDGGTLTFEDYSKKIEQENSNVFTLILMFIYSKQPFTKDAINYFKENYGYNKIEDEIEKKIQKITHTHSLKNKQNLISSPDEEIQFYLKYHIGKDYFSMPKRKTGNKNVLNFNNRNVGCSISKIRSLNISNNPNNFKFFNHSHSINNNFNYSKNGNINCDENSKKENPKNNFNTSKNNLNNSNNENLKNENSNAIEKSKNNFLTLNYHATNICLNNSKQNNPNESNNNITNNNDDINNKNNTSNSFKSNCEDCSLSFNSQDTEDSSLIFHPSSKNKPSENSPNIFESLVYKLVPNPNNPLKRTITKSKLVIIDNNVFSLAVVSETDKGILEKVHPLSGYYPAVLDEIKIHNITFYPFALLCQYANSYANVHGIFLTSSQDSLIKIVTHLKNLMGIKNINDRYDINVLNQLGKGHFGTVNLAEDKMTGEKVAIKMINKNTLNDEAYFEMVKNEIDILKILKQCPHQNIVTPHEIFEDKFFIYFVFEYLPGGTLKSYLKEKQKLTEFEVKTTVKQIAEALCFLDKLGVIHRDIKLENVLLKNDDLSIVKLSDFGLSTIQFHSQTATQTCGTLFYSAPELLAKLPYERKVDIWSLGVLAYHLIYGAFPFYSKHRNDIIYKICKERLSFPLHTDESNECSDACKTFLENLLKKNPLKRTDISKLLLSPFLIES